MRILFDSKKSEFKTPFGCLREDEKCTLSLLVPKSCKAKEVRLCLEDEEGFFLQVPFGMIREEGEYVRFGGSFSLFRRGLYFYYFTVIEETHSFRLFRQGYDQTNMEEGEKWQLTCYPKEFAVPEDYQGSVMYQIFPDRFFKAGACDLSHKLTPFILHEDWDECPVFSPDEKGIVQNNDFFGGNLKGITEKLDYLLSLGVKVLYLNPIFKAYSNHRYDTADYKTIDPMLGTEEDFVTLCREVHRREMKLILDGVFSHVGSDSLYFDVHNRFGQGACHDIESPYRGWFQWKENGYESWWGIETLPCVNELEESYLNFIIRDEKSVVAHWMKLGADGFRLDVADELPDEFIRLLRRRVKELNPHGFVLGEVWEDASNKCSYGKRRTYFSEEELDSVMNYPFRDGIVDYLNGKLDGISFARRVMTICENYPRPVVDCLMNSLSTHDTPRILTLLGTSFEGSKEEKAKHNLSDEEKNLALEKLRQAAAMQFFLPGMPCIYYGDEAGLEGFEDPLNRRCYPWDKENKDLVEFYRQLSGLKSQISQLQRGDTALEFADKEVFHISRGGRYHLIVNRQGAPYSFPGTLVFGQKTEQSDGVTVFSGGFALVEQK